VEGCTAKALYIVDFFHFQVHQGKRNKQQLLFLESIIPVRNLTVKWDPFAILVRSVNYIHIAIRQSIELKATSLFATMNYFVIEHPDGLATCRLYDRIASTDRKVNVVSGDSIYVAMGMGQEGLLWRDVVRLSH
jgi:hypothetical protein